MTRHVTEHTRKSKEHEELKVITIFEEIINKQDVKKLIPYTRKHKILIFNQYTQTYEYKMGRG